MGMLQLGNSCVSRDVDERLGAVYVTFAVGVLYPARYVCTHLQTEVLIKFSLKPDSENNRCTHSLQISSRSCTFLAFHGQVPHKHKLSVNTVVPNLDQKTDMSSQA